MSQSICTIPTETSQSIRKFRLTPVKQSSTEISCQTYQIDPQTTNLLVDESLTIDSLSELNDELPDNSPRFILINYHYTKSDGRFVNPLVGIYWRPVTCKNDIKMLYAGSVENFKSLCNCNLWFDIQDEDDLEDLESLIEK